MTAALADRPHSLDELLWWMERVAARDDAPRWEADFARSILARARRRGWRPSPKQVAAMRRIVADRLFPLALIED